VSTEPTVSLSVVAAPAPTLSAGTPIWLSVVLAALTLGGVLVTAFLSRKTGKESRVSAEELDRRGKREETLRTLRWAAERAVAGDDRESRLGVAALGSLGGSPWLEPEDQELIDAVIASVTAHAADAYNALGTKPEVYEVAQDSVIEVAELRGTEEGKPDEL
jgi:hypothetical protein